MVQLPHPYVTTGKTIALTRWTFAGKMTSLLFNTLSGFFRSFPSKEQASFILKALATVHCDSEAKKIKPTTASTFPPSICHEVMGTDVMVLVI